MDMNGLLVDTHESIMDDTWLTRHQPLRYMIVNSCLLFSIAGAVVATMVEATFERGGNSEAGNVEGTPSFLSASFSTTGALLASTTVTACAMPPSSGHKNLQAFTK